MQTKTFRLLDIGTQIPALAVRLDSDNEADRELLRLAGWGTPEQQARVVLVSRFRGSEVEAHASPFKWQEETMLQAHLFLRDHFDELESGATVDVEKIAKQSEALV